MLKASFERPDVDGAMRPYAQFLEPFIVFRVISSPETYLLVPGREQTALQGYVVNVCGADIEFSQRLVSPQLFEAKVNEILTDEPGKQVMRLHSESIPQDIQEHLCAFLAKHLQYTEVE